MRADTKSKIRELYTIADLVSRSQTASSLNFLQTDVIGREEGSGTDPTRPPAILYVAYYPDQ